MIRAALRACAAALGLRRAPTSPTTTTPVPDGRQRESVSSTWRCPDCGWTRTFDEPMDAVWCVACFREGRGMNHACERLLSGEALAEAEEQEAAEEERAADLLGPLGRRATEVTVEQALWPGMPETWPCRCGGRPFVGHSCPRCGRSEQEGRS